MKRFNTIKAAFRALFRGRRAAGGEVRPGRPAEGEALVRLSPGYVDMDPAAREAIGEDMIAAMNAPAEPKRWGRRALPR